MFIYARDPYDIGPSHDNEREEYILCLIATISVAQ